MEAIRLDEGPDLKSGSALTSIVGSSPTASANFGSARHFYLQDVVF